RWFRVDLCGAGECTHKVPARLLDRSKEGAKGSGLPAWVDGGPEVLVVDATDPCVEGAAEGTELPGGGVAACLLDGAGAGDHRGHGRLLGQPGDRGLGRRRAGRRLGRDELGELAG